MLAHQGSFTLILVLFILLVIICGICSRSDKTAKSICCLFLESFFQKWDIINLIIVLLD